MQAQEFSIPRVDAEPVTESEPVEEVASARADSGEFSVHEVDLSEEWAALANQVEGRAKPSGEAQENQDELLEAARAAEVSLGVPSDAAEPRDPEQEWVLELDSTPAGTAAEPADAISVDTVSAKTNGDAVLSSLAAELNDSMAPRVAPEREPRPPQPQAHAAAAQVANEPAHVETRIDAAAKTPAGPLSEVFDQFRADLGESATDNDDLETHYNLGIAYREMGLLEEAISEFQKVAKAQHAGKPFRYAMQCCTLLGLAFMERGQPGIAAMWYERALETPGLDQETVLALRYDLGIAQELAGDASAARKSFSQVYGMNIDYRDVGERLAALGKEQR